MKVKNGRETITSKIAYIAGFFDGEGCVRIKHANQGGNSYYVWVAITNTDKPTLDFVMELFGGQIRKAEKKTNKWAYHFLITSSEAVDMLKTLLPFLRQKKEQAELAVYFHERKAGMSAEMKQRYYKTMMKMKKEVIGNIYENSDLIK